MTGTTVSGTRAARHHRPNLYLERICTNEQHVCRLIRALQRAARDLAAGRHEIICRNYRGGVEEERRVVGTGGDVGNLEVQTDELTDAVDEERRRRAPRAERDEIVPRIGLQGVLSVVRSVAAGSKEDKGRLRAGGAGRAIG